MHPLLRQFAADQLDDEEKTAVSAAHGHYFAQRLASRKPACTVPMNRSGWKRCEPICPIAGRLAVGRPAGRAGQPLTDSGPLTGYALQSGYLHDVQALYREGIDLLQTAVSTWTR
jgi:hypothetical protein